MGSSQSANLNTVVDVCAGMRGPILRRTDLSSLPSSKRAKQSGCHLLHPPYSARAAFLSFLSCLCRRCVGDAHLLVYPCYLHRNAPRCQQPLLCRLRPPARRPQPSAFPFYSIFVYIPTSPLTSETYNRTFPNIIPETDHYCQLALPYRAHIANCPLLRPPATEPCASTIQAVPRWVMDG
jgi:hypothetical protein